MATMGAENTFFRSMKTHCGKEGWRAKEHRPFWSREHWITISADMHAHVWAHTCMWEGAYNEVKRTMWYLSPKGILIFFPLLAFHVKGNIDNICMLQMEVPGVAPPLLEE